MEKRTFLTKDETNFVKTIAIIFMLVHHFLGFPEWLENGININYLPVKVKGIPLEIAIAGQFKICVAMFAFVTGYGWYLSGKTTLKKSVSRIVKIIGVYEICLFIEYLATLIIDSSFISIRDILNQVTLCFLRGGLFIHFAWYIQFYILAIITYPLIMRVQKIDNKYMQLGIAIVPFWGGYFLLKVLGISYCLNGIPNGYFIYMPCVLMGTWIARYMNSIKKCQEKSILGGILGTILIVFLLVVRYVLGGRQYLDVFFTPILIYILINIYISFGLNKFSYKRIAENSTYMWLLHSIFFLTPGAYFFSKNIVFSQSFNISLYMGNNNSKHNIFGSEICVSERNNLC